MAWTTLQMWSLLLLAAPGIGPVLSACPRGGLFWDDCNLCWCKNDFVACSEMSCVGQPPVALDVAEMPAGAGASPQGWPEGRRGVIAYRPGRGCRGCRGRIRSREGRPTTGWACQFSSSWLEDGGCVRCACLWGGKITCEDSGLCRDGQLEQGALDNEVNRWRRRRRRSAEEHPVTSTGPPSTSAPPSTTTPSGNETEAPALEPHTTVRSDPHIDAQSQSESQTQGQVQGKAETQTAPEPQSQPQSQSETQPQVQGKAELQAVPEPQSQPQNQSENQLQGQVQSTADPQAAPEPLPTQGPAPGITAQATVVKERSCKSGSTWEEECNTCWCLDHGKAACTSQRCGEAGAPLPLGVPAAPGAPPATATPAASGAPPATVAPAASGAAAGSAASIASASGTESIATAEAAPAKGNATEVRASVETAPSPSIAPGAVGAASPSGASGAASPSDVSSAAAGEARRKRRSRRMPS